MPKQTLEDLCTSPAYSPARASKSSDAFFFETGAAAAIEDQLRSKSLTGKLTADVSDGHRLHIMSLAARIEQAQSLASKRGMRNLREHVCGELWRIADAEHDVNVFTIIPPSWEWQADQLNEVDPRKLMNSLRNDLMRSGAKSADGWLFAALHGEYDAEHELWKLHVHGIAAKGMLTVIDGLRGRPKYLCPQSPTKKGVRKTPVRVGRSPLTNMPSPLTYVLQSYFPARFAGDPGVLPRGGRQRLPEPQQREWLLWFDRWTVNDITLRMKLSVKNRRLVVNSVDQAEHFRGGLTS